MSKKYIFLSCSFIFYFIFFFHFCSVIQANTFGSEQLEQVSMGGGMHFVPNRGQIIDRNGKLRPDVFYYGTDADASIYLRQTGISYVFSNAISINHSVHEKLEEKEHSFEGLGLKTDEDWESEFRQEATYSLNQVDMSFLGCNENSIQRTLCEGEIGGYNNYYLNHCKEGVLNVKQYKNVKYKNIYDGIDVSFYGAENGGVKYDLIVAPKTNPNQIKLKWTGVKNMEINGNGNLVISTELNEFHESLPKVYQLINGTIITIKAEYLLQRVNEASNELNISENYPATSCSSYIVSFKLSEYNTDFPLIIDPWVTYYGGTGTELNKDIATDPFGNVIITGQVEGFFPIGSTAGNFVYQSGFGGEFDTYVVKFSATGARLWATYYGGVRTESVYGITSDSFGNIVITGQTGNFFPTGAIPGNTVHQATYGGTSDAFIVKLSPQGQRIWATYFGGSGLDLGYGVAIDGFNNVIVVGRTDGILPIGAIGGNIVFQGANGGGAYDAFVVKFNSTGAMQWSTYYGGANIDMALNVTTDNLNNVIIVGQSNGALPVGATPPNIVHQAVGQGLYDAFVVKFSQIGQRQWATYYGGANSDNNCNGIDVDSSNNIVITGKTFGSFPLSATAGNTIQQPIFGGISDAFIVRFSPTGILLWATYLGGNDDDYGNTVAIDPISNDIYVSGDTYSVNFPATQCGMQSQLGGGWSEDGFIVHFKSNGQMNCCTYVGGPALPNDEDCRIALFGCFIYMAGYTPGQFPVTPNAFQFGFSSKRDAFVGQLYKSSCGLDKTASLNVQTVTPSACENDPIDFTSNYLVSCDNSPVSYKWLFSGGVPSSSVIQNPVGIKYPAAGNYTVQLMVITSCDTSVKTIGVTINACLVLTVSSSPISICKGSIGVLTASPSGGTAPYTYTWSSALGLSSTTGSSVNASPQVTTIYTVVTTDNTGVSASTTVVVTVNPDLALSTSVLNISCYGGQNGSLSAYAGNGTPSYSYFWSNNQTTQTISGLSIGNYTVTIRDSKGCSASSTATIISPQPLIAQFAKGTSNCAGCGCKEWVIATATGGTYPYSYTWSDGYVNRYKNQLCPGAYLVNITDKNGCIINVNLTTP